MSYRGRCPVCSGQINIEREVFVVCENGDYEAPVVAYETKWEEFEAQIHTLTSELLDYLKSLNMRKTNAETNESDLLP